MAQPLVQPARPESAARYNEALYEELWGHMRFHPPERLPWWPAIAELSSRAPDRLEIGPGVFPRFPVRGTHVVDLSANALSVLAGRGAVPHRGHVEDARFASASFDLVGLFEVLEHVPDDEALLRELARVTRPGGHLMLTVPMGMDRYCVFDRYMGHVRRYEPDELRSKIERAGFALERFEVHEQSVREPAASVYVWFLRHAPRFVAWTLRFVFLPLLRGRRIVWRAASEWAARTAGASDCGAIFRRL